MDQEQFGSWSSWTFDSVDVEIISSQDLGIKIVYEANIIFKKENMHFSHEKLNFEVFIENNIWKISPPAVFSQSLTGQYDQ